MLPAEHRLQSSRDFQLISRSGRRSSSASLIVHATRRDAGAVRIGFVVSRRVGTAVVRNRVKRRLRHLMRQRLDQLPKGAHLVVRALPPAAEASSARLSADLDRALARFAAAPSWPGERRPRGRGSKEPGPGQRSRAR